MVCDLLHSLVPVHLLDPFLIEVLIWNGVLEGGGMSIIYEWLFFPLRFVCLIWDDVQVLYCLNLRFHATYCSCILFQSEIMFSCMSCLNWYFKLFFSCSWLVLAVVSAWLGLILTECGLYYLCLWPSGLHKAYLASLTLCFPLFNCSTFWMAWQNRLCLLAVLIEEFSKKCFHALFCSYDNACQKLLVLLILHVWSVLV